MPAALSSSLVELVAICDANESRLRYIRREFGLNQVVAVTDYRKLFGAVDAVVLALPNDLHASVGCDFLSRGIHVLCEKPLATRSAECQQLCAAARDAGAVLAVGYYSRFYSSTELTRVLVHSGFLGELFSWDYEYGTTAGWETLSGYNLNRKESGGGVLVVSGSHFLDRMLYFFDDVAVSSYADDSRGGVEANCAVTFRCRANGESLEGRVALSRTFKLGNRLRIVGERGALEVVEGQIHSVTFYPAGSEFRHELSYAAGNAFSDGENVFRLELEDFVSAIKDRRQPKASGDQAELLAAIFEKCYEIATPLDEPWADATIPRLRMALPVT